MASIKYSPSTTRFLNVDLDIWSRSDLQPLVSGLGKKVFALHVGREKRRYWARLEPAKAMKSADSAIRAFCSLIQALPKEQRQLWNSAARRDFSIGVQTAAHPRSCDFVLDAETVSAVAGLNGRIVFTVYAPDDATR